MGEARNNPRSTQYTGPLPEFDIQPLLAHRLQPSVAWLEANKEALAGPNPPKPRAEDCDLEIVAAAAMVYPSNLVPRQHWPSAVTGVGIIASRPFAEFKMEIDDLIAGRQPAASKATT